MPIHRILSNLPPWTFLWLIPLSLLICPEPATAKRRGKKKDNYRIELFAAPKKDEIVDSSVSGVWKISGKEYNAQAYCNEATLSKPEQLEVFLVNRRKDRILVLCPGSTVGEKNVATLFYPHASPMRKELMPPKDASRVEDRVLQDTFRKSLVVSEDP